MEENHTLPANPAAPPEAQAAQQSPGADVKPALQSDAARADALYASAMRARTHRLNREGALANPPKKVSAPSAPEKPQRDDPDCERDERRHSRRPRGRDRFTRRLIWLAIVLLLLIALVLLVLPRVGKLADAFTPEVNITVPDNLQAMLPDETMGYTAIDFTNAILGESRERKELVVMEQDVDVTSKISQDLLRLSLFSKVKIIHSYGTGVYTVALDEIKPEQIVVDEETKIITVTIPHTTLSYVNVDVGKTEFEDTQKSLLAIGDIKLTTEQKHTLDQSIDEALRARLNERALFVKADEIALNKVREILQPIVDSISDEYVVKVMMEQA